MKTLLIEIGKIKQNKDNPRKLSQSKEWLLRESIEKNPKMLEARPIIINQKNIIIAGNQRYSVLKKLGKKKVEVIQVEVTPEEENNIIILDNYQFGIWDTKKIRDFDFDFTKMRLKVDEKIKPFKQDGLATDIKSGDIFKIKTKQTHTIYCNDCRIINIKSDLVLTDPPYATNDKGGAPFRNLKPIVNDAITIKEYKSLIDDYLKKQDTKGVFIFHNWRRTSDLKEIIENNGYKLNALICWDKLKGVILTDIQIARRHEFIYYASKEHTLVGGVRRMHNVEECLEDVIKIKRAKNEYHYTEKPVNLLTKIIRANMCRKVTDGFMGSGSTLIASEKCGVDFVGAEITPFFCQVSINRFRENFDCEIKCINRDFKI